MVTKKVCLVVIDGWGFTQTEHGNAIKAACTPHMDKLEGGDNIYLEASEENVGVPLGQMGNSEVGHLNIGAGRVVYQDIVRVNQAIRNKTLVTNPALINLCEHAKANSNSRLHLMGLVSNGGVHSHINHLFALVEAAKELGVSDCYVHFFSDGRDTSPSSGIGFIKETKKFMEDIGYGKIATVVGRYYAMDRDLRWERIKVAYDAMVSGVGDTCDIANLEEEVLKRYSLGESDEFLKPICLDSNGLVKDNDSCLFFDFRSDRMRQIVTAFGLEQSFNPKKKVSGLKISCLTQYKAEFNRHFEVLFPAVTMDNVLAEWLSKQGIKQLHVAETEKYAHVTFFFNGGQEIKFDLEDRSMVPSPKVATYDLQPEMNCKGVADEVIKGIESGKYEFVMCNFAPPDMVGHTGKYAPTVVACTATDEQIGRIMQACKEHDYVFFVTADHGNAEKMFADDNSPHTAHTMFPVPFANDSGIKMTPCKNRAPALCDVAPTILDVMGLPIPKEMSGHSLLMK